MTSRFGWALSSKSALIMKMTSTWVCISDQKIFQKTLSIRHSAAKTLGSQKSSLRKYFCSLLFQGSWQELSLCVCLDREGFSQLSSKLFQLCLLWVTDVTVSHGRGQGNVFLEEEVKVLSSDIRRGLQEGLKGSQREVTYDTSVLVHQIQGKCHIGQTSGLSLEYHLTVVQVQWNGYFISLTFLQMGFANYLMYKIERSPGTEKWNLFRLQPRNPDPLLC